MQFFCQAATYASESTFSLKIITIARGIGFAGRNDWTSVNTTSNNVTGAGTPATNARLYSHDGKCRILANRPASHLDQISYSPYPLQEQQLAAGVAVVVVSPNPAEFLIVHSSLQL